MVDTFSIIIALVFILIATFFRVEMVQFFIKMLRKAIARPLSWLKDFERLMTLPLSWLLCVLLFWASFSLLEWDSSTFIYILGVPLIWTIVNFFNFITTAIIKHKGWDRSSTTDDNSRIVIVSEGIGLVKYVVVVVVLSLIYLRINEDSPKFIIVMIISIGLTIALGSYTWVQNIIGGLALLSQ